MNFLIIIKLLKMFYDFFWYTAKFLTIFFNIFWFVCNLSSAAIPWLTLLLVIICVLSKFVKLKSPNEKVLISLMGGDSTDDLSFWPIANRGGAYDAPENSIASLKKCLSNGYRNILLDGALTSCGEIAIIHKSTLEKAGITKNINQIDLTDLENINISETHPLGSQFGNENVYTIVKLLELLETYNLTIFLLLSDSSARVVENLKNRIKENISFTRRIILISRSPSVIYQLRKTFPDLICGLWTERTPSLKILKTSTLLTSIYGAIFRNIISPVIGISLVFISKDEFNLQISELWKNVGVRPIVYNVNSPNEKRYFQKAMKTQYLTDSLRSEPKIITSHYEKEKKNLNKISN